MDQQTLTAFSSGSIVASGLCLVAGWYFVRVKKITLHRNAMLAATVCAGIFLVAYLTRWNLYGSKPFEGEGGWRVFYLANLLPHILMAMMVGPLALYQIYLALAKKDFDRHRRFGRITVPIWLYVAASGWLIYLLLYVIPF